MWWSLTWGMKWQRWLDLGVLYERSKKRSNWMEVNPNKNQVGLNGNEGQQGSHEGTWMFMQGRFHINKLKEIWVEDILRQPRKDQSEKESNGVAEGVNECRVNWDPYEGLLAKPRKGDEEKIFLQWLIFCCEFGTKCFCCRSSTLWDNHRLVIIWLGLWVVNWSIATRLLYLCIGDILWQWFV